MDVENAFAFVNAFHRFFHFIGKSGSKNGHFFILFTGGNECYHGKSHQ